MMPASGKKDIAETRYEGSELGMKAGRKPLRSETTRGTHVLLVSKPDVLSRPDESERIRIGVRKTEKAHRDT